MGVSRFWTRLGQFQRVTVSPDYGGGMKPYANNLTSNWAYIAAWLLAALLSALATVILDLVLAETLIGPSGGLLLYLLATALLGGPMDAGIWIWAYRQFPELKLQKVWPYMIIVGGLGVLGNLTRTVQDYTDAGLDPPVDVIVTVIITYGIWLALFRIYFRRHGRL